MAAKNKTEDVTTAIKKLDKAIDYKLNALTVGIGEMTQELEDTVMEVNSIQTTLSSLSSKISGLNDLSKSIRESINIRNGYLNSKSVGSRKVPKIDYDNVKWDDDGDTNINIDGYTKLDKRIDELMAFENANFQSLVKTCAGLASPHAKLPKTQKEAKTSLETQEVNSKPVTSSPSGEKNKTDYGLIER